MESSWSFFFSPAVTPEFLNSEEVERVLCDIHREDEDFSLSYVSEDIEKDLALLLEQISSAPELDF